MWGTVYASSHGIQKRPSDLLGLQGRVRHPVWVLGTELRSSATTLHVLNIWAISPGTTVFKSYMLNGRTGGIIKGLNSSSFMVGYEGTKRFLYWHPFSLCTGIRGGSIWKTAKWWGDVGGKELIVVHCVPRGTELITKGILAWCISMFTAMNWEEQLKWGAIYFGHMILKVALIHNVPGSIVLKLLTSHQVCTNRFPLSFY